MRLRAAGAGVFHALATDPRRSLRRELQPDAAAWQMLLSDAPTTDQPQALASWRGRVDSLALRARYTDRRLYAKRVPADGAARILFSMLEQNRVEALGARHYIGVWDNLAALAHGRWVRARPEVVIRRDGAEWAETFALLTRVPLLAPLPESASVSLAASWRDWMSGEQVREVEKLVPLIADQDAFAEQAGYLIETLFDADRTDRRIEISSRADAPEQPRLHLPAQRPSAVAADEGIAANTATGIEDDAPARAPKAPPDIAYRIFNSTYDSVVGAAELYDAVTLARLRSELDRRLGSRVSKIARWAHRLQRKLLQLQMRSWQFDCEEGELDTSRLTRVVTHPLEALVYRQETAPSFPDTVVSLLVDNSGSMRGVPIATAAVCADLLGRVLERCGIKTEVLGFTTRSWRGGRAFQEWVAAGRPENPGRIAELCHVVYKSAEEPWRRAGVNLGAMLGDGLLKENIDGEALLWAQERLMRRPEPRKILVVISDGAPLDDATLDANDKLYLDRHLHFVIKHMKRNPAMELAAIGIGHDVGAHYRRAVTLQSADDLGEAIASQLIDLFVRSARL